jgi:sensor histidine kinase YesM
MTTGNKIIVCLSLLLFPVIATGQDTLLMFQQLRRDSLYNMDEYARYYVDVTNKEEQGDVLQKQFLPDSDFYTTIRSHYGRRHVTAWIQWILHNPRPNDEQALLLFNWRSFLSLYYEDREGLHFVKDNHSFFSFIPKDERRGFLVPVRAGSTIKVYARMKDPVRNFAKGFPVIARPSEYAEVMSKILYEARYYEFADVLFLSIILFITIHTLAQYFINRRKEFLLYAFYAFSVFSYFLLKFEEAYYSNIFFSYFPYIHKYGNNPFSYLMFFAYYRFVRTFINFKEIARWFYRVIIITEKILLAAIVADFLLVVFSLTPEKAMLFNVLRSCLIVMAFTGIFLLFRTRKPLPLFIAVGSGCFVLGALVAMILSWMNQGPYLYKFDPIGYMQLGIVIELLCFTLGLSYKTSLIEKEKLAAQRQLIVQLEENKKLQEELTTRLETRVEEQTSHIISQQQQLEKEKEQQLTLEFTKKITEMELQLLKSQLNPHFYFNTLHNLYGLAMIAPKKAPDAILKLSDIMEYVIYDCRHDKVPVVKELRFINSYIDLEKLRYDDSANISLRVLGEAEGKFISPLLLIQFVENAFKHGMEHHKKDSYLEISINIENGSLKYESVNSINDIASPVSGGVGLVNVKKRLEIIYPGKHQLHIYSDDHEYKVQLSLQLT